MCENQKRALSKYLSHSLLSKKAEEDPDPRDNILIAAYSFFFHVKHKWLAASTSRMARQIKVHILGARVPNNLDWRVFAIICYERVTIFLTYNIMTSKIEYFLFFSHTCSFSSSVFSIFNSAHLKINANVWSKLLLFFLSFKCGFQLCSINWFIFVPLYKW